MSDVQIDEQTNPIIIEKEKRELMALWPDIVRDINEVERQHDTHEATTWLDKILQYNVPNSKKKRSLSIILSYKMLATADQLSEENLRLFQGSWAVLDDFQDRSKQRWGQPCWYLTNDVGFSAGNDAILLEHACCQLLKIHFKGKPYTDFIETFHQTSFLTALGQSLDLLLTKHGSKPNFNLFTMDRYKTIIKYKAAYFVFVGPVQLAMFFTGIKDPEIHRQVKDILIEIGAFYQLQDDYLDCYADPKVFGKVGRDIQEGKCSWPIVTALQLATPAQKKNLKECYGIDDHKKVAKVKQLYNELELQSVYAAFEEQSFNIMKAHIQQLSCNFPQDLFYKLLEMMYRRDT